MKTEIKLPSGKKGFYPSVVMETMMTGKHHKTLLTAPASLFERTIASIIKDLMDEKYDVNKISFTDMIYLFFLTRATSVSPVYSVDWVCNRKIKSKASGVEGDCNAKNTFELDITKMKVISLPDSFDYPKYDCVINETETKVFVRLLTLSEEFDIIDDLLETGIAKEDLYGASSTLYARERLLRSLSFEDSKFATFTKEEKEAVLDSLSFSINASLLQDLEFLLSTGIDLSPKKVKCETCGGVLTLGIPFSSEFFLPQKKR